MRQIYWKYGLLEPVENLELIIQMMFLNHLYKNDRVGVERRRRKAIQKVYKSHPTVGPLKEAVAERHRIHDRALTALRDERARLRERKIDPSFNRVVREAKAELKTAQAALTEAKAALKKDEKAVIDLAEIDVKSNSKVLEARHTRVEEGLWWGAYHCADEAMNQACKAPMLAPVQPGMKVSEHEKKRRGPRPKFRCWLGEGRIGVQIQGGMSVDQLFSGSNNNLRIDPVRPDAWDRVDGGSRRQEKRHTVVHMRIQSDEKGKPIWASWPLVMHRPLPPGARIMNARVCRESIAGEARWSLLLSIRTHEEPVVPATHPDDWIALDLAWRKLPKGLRVGYLVSTTGEEIEVFLPPEVTERLYKIRSLASIREQHLNDLKDWFPDWLATQPIPEALRTFVFYKHDDVDDVDDDDDDDNDDNDDDNDDGKPRTRILSRAQLVSRMRRWKAPRRFARWILKWAENRWPGDEEGFLRANGKIERNEDGKACGSTLWREKDKHLWIWGTHLRDKVYRRRREVYRLLGNWLAKEYGGFVYEKLDLRTLQRHQEPEEEKGEIAPARAQQPMASPSELRDCIKAAFEKARRKVIAIDPKHTTQRCASCGCLNDVPPDVVHITCVECGEIWDRDANACRNLLYRREKWADGDPIDVEFEDYLIPREVRVGRFQKAKAKKAAKAAEKEAKEAAEKKDEEPEEPLF